MQDLGGFAIAAIIASCMTWIELDKKFYVPKSTAQWLKLNLWRWGFIAINGVLAGGLFLGADQFGSFKENVPPWFLRAALMGTSYLAIIRLKIGKFQNARGEESSAGFEAIYDGAKEVVYKNINEIVRADRTIEAQKKTSETMIDLVNSAKLRIANDRLLSSADKKRLKRWVLQLTQGGAADEFDRKLSLAVFILSGDDDGEAQ